MNSGDTLRDFLTAIMLAIEKRFADAATTAKFYNHDQTPEKTGWSDAENTQKAGHVNAARCAAFGGWNGGLAPLAFWVFGLFVFE